MKRYIVIEKSKQFKWSKIVTQPTQDGVFEVIFKTKSKALDIANWLRDARGDISEFWVQELQILINKRKVI